jgi:hypothetical protein
MINILLADLIILDCSFDKAYLGNFSLSRLFSDKFVLLRLFFFISSGVIILGMFKCSDNNLAQYKLL